jgi:hypothetical protein
MNDMDFFVGKYVIVEADEYSIVGRLLDYEEGSDGIKPHRPFVIVLETMAGKVILRGNWIAIKRLAG